MGGSISRSDAADQCSDCGLDPLTLRVIDKEWDEQMDADGRVPGAWLSEKKEWWCNDLDELDRKALLAAVGLSIELASLKDLAISNAAGMKNLAELVDSIKLDDIMALLDALTREAKGILVQAELQVNARKELLDEMRVTAEAIRKHNEDSADADLILKAANVAGGVAVFFPPVGTVIGAATTVTSLALQEVKDNAVSKLDAAAIERMDTKMVADNLHGMTIAQHLQAVSYLQMTLLARYDIGFDTSLMAVAFSEGVATHLELDMPTRRGLVCELLGAFKVPLLANLSSHEGAGTKAGNALDDLLASASENPAFAMAGISKIGDSSGKELTEKMVDFGQQLQATYSNGKRVKTLSTVAGNQVKQQIRQVKFFFKPKEALSEPALWRSTSSGNKITALQEAGLRSQAASFAATNPGMLQRIGARFASAFPRVTNAAKYTKAAVTGSKAFEAGAKFLDKAAKPLAMLAVALDTASLAVLLYSKCSGLADPQVVKDIEEMEDKMATDVQKFDDLAREMRALLQSSSGPAHLALPPETTLDSGRSYDKSDGEALED